MEKFRVVPPDWANVTYASFLLGFGAMTALSLTGKMDMSTYPWTLSSEMLAFASREVWGVLVTVAPVAAGLVIDQIVANN